MLINNKIYKFGKYNLSKHGKVISDKTNWELFNEIKNLTVEELDYNAILDIPLLKRAEPKHYINILKIQKSKLEFNLEYHDVITITLNHKIHILNSDLKHKNIESIRKSISDLFIMGIHNNDCFIIDEIEECEIRESNYDNQNYLYDKQSYLSLWYSIRINDNDMTILNILKNVEDIKNKVFDKVQLTILIG